LFVFYISNHLPNFIEKLSVAGTLLLGAVLEIIFVLVDVVLSLLQNLLEFDIRNSQAL
jgi:hypothetical protein